MNDEQAFQSNPRDCASQIIKDGRASPGSIQAIRCEKLALECLRHMSFADIRDVLDNLELSPRFTDDADTP